jgi:predicted TIM-barrel fold metal-dependent hydrolase
MQTNHPVDTKEPYRIDVHHHVLPKFYLDALERGGIESAFNMILPDWSLEAHLDVMDKNKIAIGMASIPAGFYFESEKIARDLARRCNEYLASLRREYPTRFGAFAALPLPDVNGALKEATYALNVLELDGIVMMSNVVGQYAGDPDQNELFAELNRRDAVVYIHPGDPPPQGIPTSIQYPIDMALETVRAVMSLLYNGVFERYLNLRFIFSHCGGAAPYLAHRIVRGRTWVRGEGGTDPGMLDRLPNSEEVAEVIAHLQRQYYDSMTANEANGLDTLQAFVDPTHILLGTDHAILPARYQPLKMRKLMRYKGFDDTIRMGVERENALRLFPRLKEVL